MAKITARAAYTNVDVRLSDFDFAGLFDNADSYSLGFRNETIGGVKLKGALDFTFLQNPKADFSEEHFIFNFQNLKMDSNGNLLSGTITDLMSARYDPDADVYQVDVVLSGLNVSGAALRQKLLAGNDAQANQLFIDAFSGADTIRMSDHNDKVQGWGGNDRMYGYKGNDQLWGGAGKDKLWGQDGKDKLYGDGGNDRIDGGKGADKLWGGAGKDNFVFHAGDGKDRVMDFEVADKITHEAGRRICSNHPRRKHHHSQ